MAKCREARRPITESHSIGDRPVPGLLVARLAWSTRPANRHGNAIVSRPPVCFRWAQAHDPSPRAISIHESRSPCRQALRFEIAMVGGKGRSKVKCFSITVAPSATAAMGTSIPPESVANRNAETVLMAKHEKHIFHYVGTSVLQCTRTVALCSQTSRQVPTDFTRLTHAVEEQRRSGSNAQIGGFVKGSYRSCWIEQQPILSISNPRGNDNTCWQR